MTDQDEWYDPESGTYIVNPTGVSNEDVIQAAKEQHPHLAEFDKIARALARNYGMGNTRAGGIFQRDRYATPEAIAEQMKLAAYAARYDDVVSGVLESSESLAFTRVSFETPDPDQQDVWNQIAADLDLDNLLRQMWRELFTISQFYAAVWYKRKSFRVRGIANDRPKRKTFNLVAPQRVSFLDPLRVVPVGNFLFGQEQLAYVANRDEAVQYDKELADENSTDLVVRQFFVRRYEPDRREAKFLRDLGFDPAHLFLLNDDVVSRHTLTRATYERFADVRMASIFELLDLKNLLRAMDRTMLLGSINYIVLVRIGTDDRPGKQAEVAAMTSRVQQGSRLPVLVGDHRLQVDIVQPDDAQTLKPERYNNIDSRITARLYNLLVSGGYEAGKSSDDSLKLSRVMGRAMESRRHMLRRYIERTIVKPTYERNPSLTEMPKLRFAPRRIALTFDPNLMAIIKDLRDRGDLSRGTMLGELDFSQDEEARKREVEAEMYDEIFNTQVPHSSPSNTFNPDQNPRDAGRNQGGSRNGGGRPEGSPDSRDREGNQ